MQYAGLSPFYNYNIKNVNFDKKFKGEKFTSRKMVRY